MSRNNLVFMRVEGMDFVQIADDPIIRSMERWGLPPWLVQGGAYEEEEEEEDDG